MNTQDKLFFDACGKFNPKYIRKRVARKEYAGQLRVRVGNSFIYVAWQIQVDQQRTCWICIGGNRWKVVKKTGSLKRIWVDSDDGRRYQWTNPTSRWYLQDGLGNKVQHLWVINLLDSNGNHIVLSPHELKRAMGWRHRRLRSLEERIIRERLKVQEEIGFTDYSEKALVKNDDFVPRKIERRGRFGGMHEDKYQRLVDKYTAISARLGVKQRPRGKCVADKKPPDDSNWASVAIVDTILSCPLPLRCPPSCHSRHDSFRVHCPQ
jgi:hypothetical protein